MRKLPVIAAMAAMATALSAATLADVFDARVGELISEINSSAPDDYAYLDACATELTELIVSTPDSLAANLAGVLPELTYVRARSAAGLGDLDAAYTLLETAVDEGYSGYYTLTGDTLMRRVAAYPGYPALLDTLRARGDYRYILAGSMPYSVSQRRDTLPCFTYEDASGRELTAVRTHFNLDSIAGSGDDLTRVGRVLRFVNTHVRHDGASTRDFGDDAIGMYLKATAPGSAGLNCRGLAKLTNQLLLALGYDSRYVTCMPRRYINDCHVINAVYIPSLGDWVYADPMMGTMVYDESGRPLSIAAVRAALIAGRPLRLGSDARYNGIEVDDAAAADYLNNYMAKNLYYVEVPVNSHWNAEATPERYVALVPPGFTDVNGRASMTLTSDEQYFWQSPSK